MSSRKHIKDCLCTAGKVFKGKESQFDCAEINGSSDVVQRKATPWCESHSVGLRILSSPRGELHEVQ